MLSNLGKLFKKGASSPSSKDRPNPFGGNEHSHSAGGVSGGTKGRGGSSRGNSQSSTRGGRSVRHQLQHDWSSERDEGSFSKIDENLQPGNGHLYVNGHSPASPRTHGATFDDLLDDRSGTSSPGHHPFVNGKPVTDPKVLQLLGANEEDENVIAEWMAPKDDGSLKEGDGSSECSHSHRHDDEHEDEDDSDSEDDNNSSPVNSGGGSWPQKSELPPSFEFARPIGQQTLGDFDGLGNAMQYPPEKSPPQAKSVNGEEPLQDDGIASSMDEDNNHNTPVADPLDTHLLPPTRTPGPGQTSFRASSPRPSNEYSSHSSRATQDRSWGSNMMRPEGVSWGSTNGSVSPRWGGNYSGQPSPERGNHSSHLAHPIHLNHPNHGNHGNHPNHSNHPAHPLPAPPVLNSVSAPHSPKLRPNHHPRPVWIEAPNPGGSRDWPSGGPMGYKVPQSPSHHRTPPRSHLSPTLVSPLPSPPRSPLVSPRTAFPAGSWSPLPTPPISSHTHSPFQSPPRSPSRFPRTLTKWKKIKQIGVGSFGTVHEAINLDDGSFFAVKVSHDESIPAEIQKEIEVLSMLRHPNVVQYFGTAMEDGHLCIFLELMQNSLQAIIKAFHHFDETLISTYTRQILQGLEYLHRKNTIHRDIKCANILVDKDGQVKLADFGLAKEVGLSLATSCKGTPYFMAPEILKPHSVNKRGYGLPVDIWSLGCTVLEMADGQPPWSFLQGFSFFFKLNKGELPPIPQHLSQSCKDFIKRCLQFRPEDRPTASELLLHPFVANAPATAAAAAFVSPSPAAMYMRNTTILEAPQGRNGEGHQTRNGQVSIDVTSGPGSRPDSPHHRLFDQQHHRPDLQHHRPDSPQQAQQHTRPVLQRSPRLDRSLNRSSSNRIAGGLDPPDTPRSASLEAAFNYNGQHHGW